MLGSLSSCDQQLPLLASLVPQLNVAYSEEEMPPSMSQMAVNGAEERLVSYDVEKVVEPCQAFLNGLGIHALYAGP